MMTDQSLSRLHDELIHTLAETGRCPSNLPPVSDYRFQSSKGNSARSPYDRFLFPQPDDVDCLESILLR